MKHLITVSLIVAAIVLYGIGLSPAANIFVVLGVLAETIFWFRIGRLFRRREITSERSLPEGRLTSALGRTGA